MVDMNEFLPTLGVDSTVILLEACSNTREYGVTRLVTKHYPYANLLGQREPLSYAPGRAHWDSRDCVGTVRLFADYLNKVGPNVMYLLPSYGPGHAIEANEFKQGLVMTTKDKSFAEGLKRDTRDVRIQEFSKCLTKVHNYITSRENTHKFIFLLPVSKGRTHHVCYPEYIRAITELREHFCDRDITISYKPELKPTPATVEEQQEQ